MIRYDMMCERAHRFDGWFRSSADFDVQAGRGLLACPVCGSEQVAKALMAPALASGRARGEPMGDSARADADAPATESVALVSEQEQGLRVMLREVREHVTRTAENVGERFPEVARQMHAQEIERKSVYGRATPDDARALAEEGIEVHPLPRFPDDAN